MVGHLAGEMLHRERGALDGLVCSGRSSKDRKRHSLPAPVWPTGVESWAGTHCTPLDHVAPAHRRTGDGVPLPRADVPGRPSLSFARPVAGAPTHGRTARTAREKNAGGDCLKESRCPNVARAVVVEVSGEQWSCRPKYRCRALVAGQETVGRSFLHSIAGFVRAS